MKYLDNVVEAAHGKLEQLIRPVRKGQAGPFALEGGIVGEAKLVERAFGLGPCALTVAVALLHDRLANAQS